MDWTTIGAAVSIIAFMYSMFRNFKQDVDKRFDLLRDEFKQELSQIRSEQKRQVECLERQSESLARLEGAFYERGYWQSRKTGTEEKK